MADVLAVRDSFRAEQWTMVLQERTSSGLSVRQFCQQRGISEKSYYYWQRKLRVQAIEAASPQLVALDSGSEPEDQLKIAYRGAELKLPASIDMEAVAMLLRSIQSL